MGKLFVFCMVTGWVSIIAQLVEAQHYPAQIMRNCNERHIVVERLHEKYGEERVFMAIGANKTLVETFANGESGSWTITVTTAITAQNGKFIKHTCIVASGGDFQIVDDEPFKKGEKL